VQVAHARGPLAVFDVAGSAPSLSVHVRSSMSTNFVHIRLTCCWARLFPSPPNWRPLMADPDNRDAAVIVVPVKTKSRTVRINVTLPEDTLKQIDRYAEAHGFSRSGFLAQAARRLMEAA
jgi:HicB_like antitoxin of bacterial toxin-antitoxin system